MTVSSVKKKISLIKKNCPRIKINHYSIAQKGWDSTVITVNDDIVFRFPKRQSSLNSLKLELQLLPKIHPRINLPIPEFCYFSASYDDYRQAFVGYRKIPGVEFDNEIYQQIVEAGQTGIVAQQLGEFLEQLHSFPLDKAAPAEIPSRGTLAYWRNLWDDVKKTIFPRLTKDQKDWTERLFGNYLEDLPRFQYRQTLIHTELGSEHILINPNELSISGIIDFGDLSQGDYGLDFYIIRRDYGNEFYELVQSFYHLPLDPDLAKRMNFYEKVAPLYLILGGINLNKPQGLNQGLEDLRQQMARGD